LCGGDHAIANTKASPVIHAEASSERSAALYERLGFLHMGVCLSCQKAAGRSGRCVGLRQGLMSVATIQEIGAQASLRNTGAAQSDLLWTRDVAEVISIPGRPERMVTGSDDQQLRS
jgi:hypothetical protein